MSYAKQILTRLTALCVFALVCGSSYAQLGKVYGRVADGDETLPMTTVQLRQNGAILQQTMTDMEGNYELARIEPGLYQLIVLDGQDEVEFDLKLSSGESEILNLVWYEVDNDKPIYAEEVFTVDPMVITTLDQKYLEENMTRGITEIVAGAGVSIHQRDAGEPISMRGARSGGTVYFIDGVKVIGNLELPQSAINQIDVISGGIPASLGDLNGGAILIQTGNGLRGSPAPYYTREERRDIRRRKRGKDQEGFRNSENTPVFAAAFQ